MKAPAFQLYADQFLAAENIRLMSNAEAGLYIRLMCHCWIERSIPDDVVSVGKLTSTPLAQAKRLWPTVRKLFSESSDGRLIHAGLDEEREKQRAFREAKSKAGQRGMDIRWHSDSTDSTVITDPITSDNSTSTFDSTFNSKFNDDVGTSDSPKHLEERLRRGGLTPKQTTHVLKKGKKYAEDCLAFIASPPDVVRNPVAVIVAALRDGTPIPAPKPTPPPPVTPEERERHGPAIKRRLEASQPESQRRPVSQADIDREIIAQREVAL